jgi:hypothetical protein
LVDKGPSFGINTDDTGLVRHPRDMHLSPVCI